MLARQLGTTRSSCLLALPVRGFSGAVDDVYDVIVVGGGLVGSAVACALSTNPWTSKLRVAVLDRQAPPLESASLSEIPEPRVSTITPSSVQLLTDVGAWQDVAPPRSAAFSHMQVWDWGGNAFVRYHASDVGSEQIGYVAENIVLQQAFLRQLNRPGRPSVFHWPAIVESLKLPAYSAVSGGGGMHLAEVNLAGGQRLLTRLLVGADGGRSQVRQLSDLRTFQMDYRQRGVVATVRTAQPNTTAHQRFLETGPLAVLPVRDGYSNIVWSTTPRHAAQLEASSALEFAAEVNEDNFEITQALTGGTQPSRSSVFGSGPSFEEPPSILGYVGPAPKSFPLTLCHAGRYVRPRVALVGDAAHTVHPLAGQGVNLGFGDVAQLVGALAHAVECGRDLGEPLLLEELYERPRQRANVSMMTALDSLQRVFKSQSGLLASARGVGLQLINMSPTAKQQIMKYAMGF